MSFSGDKLISCYGNAVRTKYSSVVMVGEATLSLVDELDRSTRVSAMVELLLVEFLIQDISGFERLYLVFHLVPIRLRECSCHAHSGCCCLSAPSRMLPRALWRQSLPVHKHHRRLLLSPLRSPHSINLCLHVIPPQHASRANARPSIRMKLMISFQQSLRYPTPQMP